MKKKIKSVKVGDYVGIKQRNIPGIGVFNYGVVARIDEKSKKIGEILVVADNNGAPQPFAATLEAIKPVELTQRQKMDLDSVKILFYGMLSDLRGV